MNNMSKKQEIIGLIDADLLDNGTRHPNLVLNYQNYIYDQKEHRKKRSLNVEELDFMPMK